MISINEKWRIGADPYNWTLEKAATNKETGEQYWVNKGYYPSLEHVIRAYLRKNLAVKAGEKQSLETIIDLLKELDKTILLECKSILEAKPDIKKLAREKTTLAKSEEPNEDMDFLD